MRDWTTWSTAGSARMEKKLFNNRVIVLVREEYLACLFVRQAYSGKYGD